MGGCLAMCVSNKQLSSYFFERLFNKGNKAELNQFLLKLSCFIFVAQSLFFCCHLFLFWELTCSIIFSSRPSSLTTANVTKNYNFSNICSYLSVCFFPYMPMGTRVYSHHFHCFQVLRIEYQFFLKQLFKNKKIQAHLMMLAIVPPSSCSVLVHMALISFSELPSSA